MNIDQIEAMTAELEDGAEIYITPSVPEDEEQETKYVLSGESSISPEMRLEEAEAFIKSIGGIWCKSTNTYKLKKRLIDIGE